jgi:hypothetical protein
VAAGATHSRDGSGGSDALLDVVGMRGWWFCSGGGLVQVGWTRRVGRGGGRAASSLWRLKNNVVDCVPEGGEG